MRMVAVVGNTQLKGEWLVVVVKAWQGGRLVCSSERGVSNVVLLYTGKQQGCRRISCHAEAVVIPTPNVVFT